MRNGPALFAAAILGVWALSGLACGSPPGPSAPAPVSSTGRPVAPARAVSPSATPSASASAQAKPGHGLLSVHTTPPGAMVIIEGGVLAPSPVDRLDIEAGKHGVIIALPGHVSVALTVTVVAGEHVVHDVLLIPGAAASGGGDDGGGDRHGGCSSSICQRDCFQEHAHCESDCGFCSDCSSPVDGDAIQCSVCLSCKATCKQLQKACERSCEACD